jgi:predicted Zn-dependent protease
VFKKSALPDDRPFAVTFVRDGWEPVDVLISPTGDSRTKVNAILRPGRSDGKDPQTQRTRKVLSMVFSIQEMVAQNRAVDALATIRELEKDEPNLAEVFVLKGSIYAALNDRTQARAAWERALALDSGLDRIRVELQRLGEIPATGGRP